MAAVDWNSWLAQWNRELLERLDLSQYNAFIEEDITPEVVASGWLGFPGATESQIAQLESRLGAVLPPSYRSFLTTSNGFRQPGMIVPRLLPVEEVEWFHVRNLDTIDAWMEAIDYASRYYGSPMSEDPDPFEQYLQTALEISARERVGTAVYLLNPKVVDTDGEWEAFYFAHWVPGAIRYRSFWDLMQAERKMFLERNGRV